MNSVQLIGASVQQYFRVSGSKILVTPEKAAAVVYQERGR
jgi:hypothetical protein